MDETLLATKLNAPLMKAKTVSREALIEKIKKGIECGYRLILVSAPAGSGKTTVINQWAKTTDINISWLTLDVEDNDPANLFKYLIASLQKIDERTGIHALGLFGSPFIPTFRSLVKSLVNDLYDSGKAVAIVLDNYQVIKSTFINEFLQGFLESQPEFVHIIMITREDPQLQLSKMRVRNEIIELRANDLCFNRPDAYSFFTDVMGLDVKQSTVDTFLQRTEGWIAGLQLAALSVMNYDKERIEQFANKFGGSNRYIIDYLVEEILEHLSLPLREFIYATAVLDRMNAELCDFLTQKSYSEELLNELYRLNLFLLPLDDSRTWFRYHQLFANSISAGIKKKIKDAHWKRATKWLEQNGYLAEALNYSLKSGDTDDSLRIIERLIPEFFENARLSAFLSFLDALPDTAVIRNHGVAVKKAWALLISGNVRGVRAFISQLGEDFALGLDPLNHGLYLGLNANLINYEEDPNTENLAEQALELIGELDVTAKIAVLNTLADAQKRSGKTEKALSSHRSAFDSSRLLGFTFITLLTLYQYGMTLDTLGKRKEALLLAEGYLDEMMHVYSRPVPLMGILYALLAVLYYEENSLARAEESVSKAQSFLLEMSLHWIINVDIILMNIRLAYGSTKDALDLIDSITEMSRQMNFRIFEFRNSAAKAELAMRSGRIYEALDWVSNWNLTPTDKPNASREQGYFTYIRVLLLNNSFNEAGVLFEYLESSIIEGARLGRLITLLILKAVYFALLGEVKNAAENIGKAIDLAAPQGYVRAFLDEGMFIFQMLQKLPNRNAGFVKTLVEQFLNKPENVVGWTDFLKLNQPENLKRVLIEDLSDRELELLRLIAQGMTNKEISGKLFISINTTQWHITNIYGKLGVKNRTQALSKARELNLI